MSSSFSNTLERQCECVCNNCLHNIPGRHCIGCTFWRLPYLHHPPTSASQPMLFAPNLESFINSNAQQQPVSSYDYSTFQSTFPYQRQLTTTPSVHQYSAMNQLAEQYLKLEPEYYQSANLSCYQKPPEIAAKNPSPKPNKLHKCGYIICVGNDGPITCDKTFTRKTTLNKHFKAVHQGIMQYHFCSFCGKAFNDRSNLNVHLQTHMVLETLYCSHPFCTSSFKAPRYKKAHMKKFHPNWPNEFDVVPKAAVSQPNEIAFLDA